MTKATLTKVRQITKVTPALVRLIAKVIPTKALLATIAKQLKLQITVKVAILLIM